MPLSTLGATDSGSVSRVKINDNFEYLEGIVGAPAGTTTPITVTASPFTYTAGAGMEYVYISGGVITALTRNGQSLGPDTPNLVILPPGAAVVVTYDEAPTMVADK